MRYEPIAEGYITYEFAADYKRISMTDLVFWLAKTGFPHNSTNYTVHHSILEVTAI